MELLVSLVFGMMNLGFLVFGMMVFVNYLVLGMQESELEIVGKMKWMEVWHLGMMGLKAH